MNRLLTNLLALLFFFFISCSDEPKESAEPAHGNMTINVGDTQNIGGSKTWISREPLIASVTGRLVKGLRAGNTTIMSDDRKIMFQVNVIPKYKIYDEPYTNWGRDEDMVEYMNRNYNLVKRDYDYNYDYLIYSIDGNDVMFQYIFERQKLTGVLVLVNIDKYQETLLPFLSERYVLILKENETIYLSNIPKDTLITMVLRFLNNTNYAAILYEPYRFSDTLTPMIKESSSIQRFTTHAYGSH